MAAIAYPAHPSFPPSSSSGLRAQLRLLPPRPPARRPPSATVRRHRAVALVALAALGALLGAGSLAGAGQAADRHGAQAGPSAAAPVAAATHVVQPGDTLWSVARGLQPDGDVRPLVARLRAERGPGPLVPGERLRLPV